MIKSAKGPAEKKAVKEKIAGAQEVIESATQGKLLLVNLDQGYPQSQYW